MARTKKAKAKAVRGGVASKAHQAKADSGSARDGYIDRVRDALELDRHAGDDALRRTDYIEALETLISEMQGMMEEAEAETGELVMGVE